MRELTKANAIKNIGRADTCIDLIQALSPYLPQRLYEIALYKAGVLDNEAAIERQNELMARPGAPAEG